MCVAVPLIGDATRVCMGGVPYRDTPTGGVYCIPCPRGRIAVGNVCVLCPEGSFAVRSATRLHRICVGQFG